MRVQINRREFMAAAGGAGLGLLQPARTAGGCPRGAGGYRPVPELRAGVRRGHRENVRPTGRDRAAW